MTANTGLIAAAIEITEGATQIRKSVFEQENDRTYDDRVTNRWAPNECLHVDPFSRSGWLRRFGAFNEPANERREGC